MIKPGDHVMYMGHCAVVNRVYTITASISFIKSVRSMSRDIDMYIDELVIPGNDHRCENVR